MKTKFFITCISVLLAGSFLWGCDEKVEKEAPEKYIYVNKNSLNLFFGDKVQLKANPAGETFEWTSADPAIATVTSGGLVEAVGVGSTEIIVSQGTLQTSLSVTVTVPTIDKVIVAGESGQMQVVLQVFSDRITTARIIWNNNQDSTDIAINNQSGVFKETINYSGENGYGFRIVSFDKFGNRSLPVETTGLLLQNRTVNSAKGTFNGGNIDGRINLSSATKYLTCTYIRYRTSSGTTNIVRVLPNESSVVCSDVKRNELFEYRSVFLLEGMTDSIKLEWVQHEIPFTVKLPKTEWIISGSDEFSGIWGDGQGGGSDGGHFLQIIDDNYNSAWHSRVGANLPHWFMIDMLEQQHIREIDIYLHPTYQYARIVQIFTSESPDEASWTLGMEFTFPSGRSTTVSFPTVTTCRYVIFKFIDSSSGQYSNCAEIDVFGL
jgi:hypothetical protein